MSDHEWGRWQSLLAGDPAEDLSDVLVNVQPQDDPAARAARVRDPRTRAFCDLALHLLYRNTIGVADGGPISCDDGLCSFTQGRFLERHALTTLGDPHRAAALTEERWRETWRSPDEFMQDCFSYLFRPGPGVRRIREVQFRLVNLMESRMRLGPLVREAVDLEIKSNLADPLAALQTAVQAAFPTHPEIRRYLRRLDGNPLRLWARLYAVVFPAYGLTLRPGKSWFDVAYIFTTAADGALLRTRSHDSPELLTSGENVLASIIFGMLPDLFDVDRAQVEDLPLLMLPDDSIDWLDPPDGEGDNH